MKKIYFLLVFAIIFGFAAGNKASGQDPNCNYVNPNLPCYAPWQRIDFDLPYQCNGQNKTARVTLCYYCYVSANESCYIIKEMQNVAAGCEDTVKNEILNWAVHNDHKYCGVIPCQDGNYRIRLKFPICADMDYKGNPGHYNITLNPDCTKMCNWEIERCWCNCINEPGNCWDEKCPNPHIKWTIVNWDDYGFGICQSQDVSLSELTGTQDKKIRVCQRFHTICNQAEEPFRWLP